MLFQTTEFLCLLAVVLVGLSVVQRARQQHYLLLCASYIFYGFWDVRFLLLLSLSSLIDHAAALGIAGERLPVRTRIRAAGLWLLAAVTLLGFDWRAPTAASTGAWLGVSAPLIACALIAVIGPLAYQLYFRLGERARRRAFLATSVFANLGILAFFKYVDFFRDNLLGVGQLLGMRATWPELSVVLPVGISFYTFQTMSYTIEVYRGRVEPERDIARVALFAAYFPQLVAGPIVRPGQFLPALQRAWRASGERLRSGFNLALVGLCKKVLIADQIAPLASAILDQPTGRPSVVIGFAAALFAVQIYCDFSGYTDMARGVSRMLGLDIPENFNFPYASRSLTEFWRRWHITLSTWFRDYVYIPLGGNRSGLARTLGNLLATMALAGLWHGAGWNFAIWGAYHGVLLGIERILRAAAERSARLGRIAAHRATGWLGWAVTLYLTLLGWLIFRIADLDSLGHAVRSFVILDGNFDVTDWGAWGLGRAAPFTATLAFCAFVVVHVVGYRWRRVPDLLDAASPVGRGSLYFLAGVLLFFGWPASQQPFLYFQF